MIPTIYLLLKKMSRKGSMELTSREIIILILMIIVAAIIIFLAVNYFDEIKSYFTRLFGLGEYYVP